MPLHRYYRQRFCPVGHGFTGRLGKFSVAHGEEYLWGGFAVAQFYGVIEYRDAVTAWNQAAHIVYGAYPALADFSLGDGVAAVGDALRYALDVQLWGLQAAEGDIDGYAFVYGAEQQSANRVAAQGGFEGVGGVMGNGGLQLAAS